MAVDSKTVKYGPTHGAGQADETSTGARERNLSQPGITVSELIAAVGNLKVPDNGFADDLEAVQANQGLAETPEWPDRTECESDRWI